MTSNEDKNKMQNTVIKACGDILYYWRTIPTLRSGRNRYYDFAMLILIKCNILVFFS